MAFKSSKVNSVEFKNNNRDKRANNEKVYSNNSSTNTTTNSMVSNTSPSKSRSSNRCDCDQNFIDFSKIHTISHSECLQTKRLRCDLCWVESDNKSIGFHINSNKHEERHRKLMNYVFLVNIPPPSHSHCDKLSSILVQNFTSICINDNALRERHEVVNRLNVLLKKNGLNEYKVRLYGSSLNGFGLNTSDINIDLVVKSLNSDPVLDPQIQYEKTALILSKVSDLIASDGRSREFSNIRNDYNLKVPKVRFYDHVSRLECELSITAEKSYRSSILLNQYSKIDPRVAVLGTHLREWAQIYGFDDQENGLWPPFAFPVLVIHFLQRCSPPILPCLHELYPRKHNSSDESQAQSHNSETPVKNPFDENEGLEDSFDIELLHTKWRQQNNQSVGQLWIEMLRYYAVGFDLETYVVSIRNTTHPQTHKEKHWMTRVLAIEDPYRPALNLSRSVGSMRLYNLFIEQLRNAYKYFAIPSLMLRTDNSNTLKPLFIERDFEIVVGQTDFYTDETADVLARVNEVCAQFKNGTELKDAKELDDSDTDDENKKRDENFYLKAQKLLKTYGIRMILSPEIESSINLLPKDPITFHTQYRRMPFFAKPPKYCRLCRRYGHQQNKCPDERLPELIRLPKMLDPKLMAILDDICLNLFNNLKMDTEEERLYNAIMNDLEKFIQHDLPNARLELFGSTKSGFAARRCDLDICLTFTDHETGENLAYGEIIENIGQLLRHHRSVRNIIPITSAKVPIVKFSYFYDSRMMSSVDCDISLYNILARYNTQLLRTYCNIDERVQILGFVVKHFAKTCDICDASKGSLSSYAYILMTIHFLQQRGVIPVLQEIGLETKKDRIIDEWNTWFFSDINKLNKYWKTRKNNESVAQLFLGFLRYYSEKFNYDEDVVCCRRLAPLKRLEKLWTGRKIAIEDPFLLSHNLGAGVDNQMAAFIKTSIAKGRNNIGSPPRFLPQCYKDWGQYFFDRRLLTDGLPPTGRGCRTCGKIGHKQNECPERQNRNPNNNRRQQNIRK